MTGDLIINNLDAFEHWGLNLEDGALSALLTPPPTKEFVESNNRLSHGSRVLTKIARFDARELVLPMHIVASSKDDFFAKYAKFCDEILAKGSFELKTKYQPNVVYRLIYLSASQFTQFIQEMAVFTLKVKEPDPTDRDIQAKI